MKSRIIIQEIFYFFSAGLAVFWLMEVIKPRIVLVYFDLNWLFLLWLLAAFVMLFFPDKEE